MDFRRWHVGKIAMLWIWGGVFVLLAVKLPEQKPNWIVGYALIAFIVLAPVVLSVLTWKWLGGREG